MCPTLAGTRYCSLCDLELSTCPVVDGEQAFCCAGCHAVYNILSSKGGLENFQDSTVFQQALKSGLISNPALIAEIRRERPNVPEEELQRHHMEISEMWCPSCAEIIKLMLLQEKGVCNIVVDYTTDLASIEFSPRHISKEKIYKIISSLGYNPAEMRSAESQTVSKSLYLRFFVAAFCSMNIMMFSYPIYSHYFTGEAFGDARMFAWLSMIAALPVVGYSAYPIYRRFFASIQVGLYGMETLVVIGVTTAFGLSLNELISGGTHVYFDSMSVIIAFVLLGKIVETKAKFSARDSLIRLTRSLPRRGRKLLLTGETQYVNLKEVKEGDSIVALSGEKVVLDGIVTEGSGACDESLMTGESIPVAKKVGSSLLGGSIVKNGRLIFRVTATQEDSALKRIIEMVEQDLGNKTVYVRAADIVVRSFVPIVLCIAFATAAYLFFGGAQDAGKTVAETAIIRAISILLISCPCALGIAAPLAESHMINGLADVGAIVRNRGALRLLGKESVFVFDKTGTVTEGDFTVLEGAEKLSEGQRFRLKALSSQSTHPIASAVTMFLKGEVIKLDGIQEVVGKGLRGWHKQRELLLGSRSFLQENQIVVPAENLEVREFPVSQVFYAEDGQLVAQLSLGDRVRKGAKELLSSLGNIKSVLLSGDSKASVDAVAKYCGFDDYKEQCSPLHKREYIERLKNNGETVCMLGDGINDAPALTAAHIGISVVSATDISIQVSDILLTTDRLKVLTHIRALAIKGQRIIKQNLFWAFFYNIIGIFLAVGGWLSPVFGAFAMVVSSLIVVFNAMRIKRIDKGLIS
ncbi:MAG: heavy metal translocating P-type ATPase [Chlamydiales bacterium]|jgi:heavy metal translocating P-type ATPase